MTKDEILKKEFREELHNIGEMIKNGDNVNYDYEFFTDFEIYKKYREIQDEIDREGLSIDLINKMNELKHEARKR